MVAQSIILPVTITLMVALSTSTDAHRLDNHFLVGYSVSGRPIRATRIGSGPDRTMILAGIHGDEPSGAALVARLQRFLLSVPETLSGKAVLLVPRVNPDGLLRGTRVNADGVDINRNFPTKDWKPTAPRPRYAPGPRPDSEPETRSILRLISEFKPCKIISVHAPLHQLNIDGPAYPLARAMQRYDHYRITRSIGYATPGSLGTYAGKERNIPVVTLELPSALILHSWRRNVQALYAAVEHSCP